MSESQETQDCPHSVTAPWHTYGNPEPIGVVCVECGVSVPATSMEQADWDVDVLG